MNFDPFYIVATYPYNFCWTLDGGVSNSALVAFTYKDGLIMTLDESKVLAVGSEGVVRFVEEREAGVAVELETTEVSTNFRVKCIESGRYIRHRESNLYCEQDDDTDTFRKDSTWIFIPTKINLDHTFVIARYGEDVSWTRYLPGSVIIYNKGKDNIQFEMRDNIRIERLENIGREGHTYFSHIIKNYDNLTERVAFLQGDPFIHSDNLLELCCMMADFKGFQSMSGWYMPRPCGEPIKTVVDTALKTFNGANYAIYPVDRNGAPLEYFDGHWMNCSSGYFNTGGVYNKNNSPVAEFLRRVGMPHKIKSLYFLCHAALFSVAKENILANTLENYVACSTELTKHNKQGGIEGYIVERLWHTLMTHEEYKLSDIYNITDTRSIHYITTAENGQSKVLQRISGALAGNTLKSFPQFSVPGMDYFSRIKNYAALINVCQRTDCNSMPIIINHDCAFVDSVEVARERFDKYYRFLVANSCEWDLFLGAPRNMQPVKIISRDPFIIECTYAISYTFAIHSRQTAQYIYDYAATNVRENYIGPLDTVVADKIRQTLGKIWIPYPLLCYSVDDSAYINEYNAKMKKFIDTN
jgi:hypothetical protein